MLHVDFESYCDINVRDVGAHVYARHRSCEVLMMGWAYDNDQPELWVPDGPWDYDSIPQHIVDHLIDGGLFCAHNAEFEHQIFQYVLDINIPLKQVRDTAALALINGYPKSLAGAGAAIGLPVDKQKDKRGGLLIRKFCTPRKPTKNNPLTRNYRDDFPEEWLEFCDYCRQDVVAEQEIWRRLNAADS